MSTSPTQSKRRREPASPSERRARQRTTDHSRPRNGQKPSAGESQITQVEGAVIAEPRHSFWAMARDRGDVIRELKSVDDVRKALATATDRVWIDLVSPEHEML